MKKEIRDRTLTIAQLCHSPHNCRREQPTAEDTAPLEALILTQGLRVPIEIHAMRGSKTKFGAFAGRRRYYSIARLVDRGDLPADWPIHAREYVGYDDAELIELSLSENFRKDLEDHELYAGIARAHKLGHNVEQIAHNLGDMDAVQVAQWVRLGSLAPAVFEALTTGEIDVARAKAYAATEDRALQDETFAKLRRPRDLVHPPAAEIRRALKVGDPELERRLAFVGADAYRAAGGRYELDMFAEDAANRGRVVDIGLLEELTREALDKLRAEVRTGANAPNLRFVPQPPQNGVGSTDWTLQFRPKDGEALVLPDGVVAHIELLGDGQSPEVTFWWPSASAKHGGGAKPAAATGRALPGRTLAQVYGGRGEGSAISTSTSSGAFDPYEARRVANAQLRDEAGLTAELVEILRSQRRMILRARLVEAAELESTGVGDDAADFLIWSQLRMLLGHDRISTVGAAHLYGASGDPVETRPFLDVMPAAKIWRDALQDVQRADFMSETALDEAFLLFADAIPRMKRLATAVVAGLALERSLNADGYRLASHTALALQLELDEDPAVRLYWTPTADLLAKLPKAERAAIAEPFVETAAWAPWPRLKDAELTDRVLAVVTDPAAHAGRLHIRPAAIAAAAAWVHPQLRFAAPPAPIAADDVAEALPELEAAE